MSGGPEGYLPGTRVGRYVVEGLLGEGDMGTVYLAGDESGRRVALKVVKPALAHDDTFRRRFEREASVARRVRHPRVVDVLETGEHEGLPFMAQRYVGERSLAAQIGAEPLDVPETARILHDVAEGLEALHELELVHRDVKPSNILLDDEGRAHIADFGLTKDPQNSFLTRPGQALGTLDYVSPEQIRGLPVGTAADVYSLGCVVWECLFARPVFADHAGMKVLWAHLRVAPEHPCRRRDDLPDAAAEALLEALAKEPDRRPSAGALARRFGRAVAG